MKKEIIKNILDENRVLLKPITPVAFAKKLIEDLVVDVKQDELNFLYMNYLDSEGRVVMEYDNGSKFEKGRLGISSERIYDPIQRKFPQLDRYEKMSPIIRDALEKITEFNIPPFNYINNKTKIEQKWGRKSE